MAKTLLGVCDRTSLANDSDWSSNKIGGNPDWLKKDFTSDVKCETCEGPVVFIGQLYCPVEETDRVFYLFLCCNQTCIKSSKSWTVLRCQSRMENVIKNQSLNTKTEIKSAFDFDPETEDWGDEALDGVSFQPADVSNKCLELGKMSSVNEDNLVECGMRELKLDSEESKFKPFFINVFDEEELSSDSFLKHEQDLLKKYLKQERLSLEDMMYPPETAKKSDKESYQKFKISCMKENQQKFFETVKKCPEQIIRYCYKGAPLVYSTPPASSKILRCSCGSSRTFEFQIMPSISNFMVANCDVEGLCLEGLDIGTVYIYTCSSNCWFEGRDKMKPELAIVERDNMTEGENTKKNNGRYKL